MQRFYFHFKNEHGTQYDREGVAFADLDQALEDATRAARDMMAEAARGGHNFRHSSFEIATDDGPAAVLSFYEIVKRDLADEQGSDRRAEQSERG